MPSPDPCPKRETNQGRWTTICQAGQAITITFANAHQDSYAGIVRMGTRRCKNVRELRELKAFQPNRLCPRSLQYQPQIALISTPDRSTLPKWFTQQSAGKMGGFVTHAPYKTHTGGLPVALCAVPQLVVSGSANVASLRQRALADLVVSA